MDIYPDYIEFIGANEDEHKIEIGSVRHVGRQNFKVTSIHYNATNQTVWLRTEKGYEMVYHNVCVIYTRKKIGFMC